MKPKHQRLIFIMVSVLFLCASVLLTLRAFRENLIFFYSPTEAAAAHLTAGQTIRLGGLVEKKSLRQEEQHFRFRITDGNTGTEVFYTGLLPNLFREGQGVIAEGAFNRDGTFAAKRILAKHDEKYMPKEVVDALKKSGRWQEGQP